MFWSGRSCDFWCEQLSRWGDIYGLLIDVDTQQQMTPFIFARDLEKPHSFGGIKFQFSHFHQKV